MDEKKKHHRIDCKICDFFLPDGEYDLGEFCTSNSIEITKSVTFDYHWLMGNVITSTRYLACPKCKDEHAIMLGYSYEADNK